MFIAGCNMPGYMPDSEPVEFETFDDAKRYIIGMVKNEEEGFYWNDDEQGCEELSAFAEDVNLQSGEFSAQCLGRVYWVTKE